MGLLCGFHMLQAVGQRSPVCGASCCSHSLTLSAMGRMPGPAGVVTASLGVYVELNESSSAGSPLTPFGHSNTQVR